MLTCGTQMVSSMESYFHVHCQHSTADHNHQPNARLSFPLEYEDDDFVFEYEPKIAPLALMRGADS